MSQYPDFLHESDGKQKALMLCALRFDGYRFLDAIYPDSNDNFSEFAQTVIEERKLHEDEESKLPGLISVDSEMVECPRFCIV